MYMYVFRGFLNALRKVYLTDAGSKSNPCTFIQSCFKPTDDSEDTKELREFLEEATIMKDFKHPNVLSLYGVVITQNKPHVLLPFMAYGDLRGYVNNARNVSKSNLYNICHIVV